MTKYKNKWGMTQEERDRCINRLRDRLPHYIVCTGAGFVHKGTPMDDHRCKECGGSGLDKEALDRKQNEIPTVRPGPRLDDDYLEILEEELEEIETIYEPDQYES